MDAGARQRPKDLSDCPLDLYYGHFRTDVANSGVRDELCRYIVITNMGVYMIKRKTDLLQIRLETELLDRFKAMADHQGVTVSVLLRHYMDSICKNFETSQWRKAEWEKKQAQKNK